MSSSVVSQSASLLARYRDVRSASEALIANLSVEDCQAQSMPDASPAKWHLAHTTWFFETFVLEPFEPGFAPFHPSFRVLFNSYYQGVGPQPVRAQRGLMTSPTLAEVLRYRAQVDSEPLLAGAAGVIRLGLQHEQQHQELLLTDIKHLLSFNAEHAPYALLPAQMQSAVVADDAPAPMQWLSFEGGLFELGYSAEIDGDFAFDNEGPQHRCFVAPFEMASRLVTEGEYALFMADSGYTRPELWLSRGWDWVQEGQRSAPLYWHKTEAEWEVHTLYGPRPLHCSSPVVHLSYFEADAYARWLDARLPTEAEWELAARSQPITEPEASALARGFQPEPPNSTNALSLQQLWNQAWQWTQSPFTPYPGFRPALGAIGEYNGKFMCDQWVLRGGSCATPPGHIRATYRNFFPAHAQWQFSGIRLARDAR